MIRVLIAENAPSSNKGEMAIVEGIIETLKILGDVDISMFSAFPDIDLPRYRKKIKIIDIRTTWSPSDAKKIFPSLLVMLKHMVFLVTYKLFRLRALQFFKGEVWNEYLKADVIIFGHDSSFGIGGDPANPLLYPVYLPFFAKLLGKPIIFYGGSVPHRLPRKFSWLFKKAYKYALNKVDVITLREGNSYQNLKDIGVQDNRMYITADLAVLLKPATFERINEIMKQEDIDKLPKPLLGMTIRRDRAILAFPELNNPELSYQKHIKIIAQVIDDLIDKLNFSVVFIPHCVGLVEKPSDDRIVATDIFQLCKNKDRIKVIRNEYGPNELKGLIGQLDLFIGERLHSVVSSMTMGIPSICISYSSDRRLDIIKMFGQENAICHIENLTSKTLLFKINKVWAEKNKINKDLESKAEIIKKRAILNGKLLKEFLDTRLR